MMYWMPKIKKSWIYPAFGNLFISISDLTNTKRGTTSQDKVWGPEHYMYQSFLEAGRSPSVLFKSDFRQTGRSSFVKKKVVSK